MQSTNQLSLKMLHAYWDMRAPTYNVPDVFGRRVLKEYVRRIRPTSLVEVGCGHGELFPVYSRVPYVVGLDWSQKMLNRAQQRVERHGYNIKLQRLNIVESTLNERFDVAVTRTCLMHIPPEHLEKAAGNVAALSDTLLLFEYFEEYPSKPLALHNWLHDYKTLFTGLGYELTDYYVRPDLPQVLFHFNKKEIGE